ncbi:MAG: hypothetical protein M3N04_01765 [Actinomycetota bacterium]|nr:hypothetical protein [Actinomycetota bacterium]
MRESLTFAPSASGFELRQGDEVLGRVVSLGDARARAETGQASWEFSVEGDRQAPAATWRLVARDAAGEQAACYYHGSMRGGRVLIGDRTASLRRELGLATEWRLRVRPDAALRLWPVPLPDGMQLELSFVPGSAHVPELLLLLVCWSIVTEEQTGPARLAG